MDRTTAVIIVLGIFLGSIYSFAYHREGIGLPPLSGDENNVLQERSGSKLMKAQEAGEWSPPPRAPTPDDDTLAMGVEDVEVFTNPQNALKNASDFHEISAGGVYDIVTSPDGVSATHPDIEKRYFYENYVAVMVVLTGDSGPQELANQLGAVIAEEFEQKILIFLPEGSEQELDVLVRDGRIYSYEIGGWGTGLGKA